MTTELDLGSSDLKRLQCPINKSNLYPTLVLALRDMRSANNRDPETGSGSGGASWIGLALGMIVLDTLSGEGSAVRKRFEGLLNRHGVNASDSHFTWILRNSLLHGYGLPKKSAVGNRETVLTPIHDTHAVDSQHDSRVVVSVPVFCSHLVERIAAEAKDEWDTSLINTDIEYL